MTSFLVLATANDTSFEVNRTEEGDLSGDLQIRGASVFGRYHNKPEATAKEFASDGWFNTGDTASIDPEDGVFKILGRSSVDIIKSVKRSNVIFQKN